MRRQLRRPDFGLLFRRQRGQLQRLAVGADWRLLRHGAGHSGRRAADGARRTRRVFVGTDDARARNAVVIGRRRRCRRTVGIDHLRRAGGPAIAGIVGRHDRAGRDRRRIRVGRAAVTRIIRRHDRAGRGRRHVGIDRAAIARIVGHDTGRRQRRRAWRVVVFQLVEIGRAGPAAFIDHISAGRIAGSSRIDRAGGHRIALLGLRKRGGERSARRGGCHSGTDRQNSS